MDKVQFTTKRFDANTYQVFRDGKFIGCASKYMSGEWFFHGLDGKKQAQHGGHASPKALAKHIASNAAEAS